MNGERVDVRREPLVVRDGCAPDRTPVGRWPSDCALVRSEQFAVNEAMAELTDGGLFAVHAPPGTGVSEVYGDMIAALVTERARRIAELPEPGAAFGEPLAWGAHVITAPIAELAGFELVLGSPGRGGSAASPEVRPGPGLPSLGGRWRDRATRADYFGSTARLADGVGAWAMLAARLGDRSTNRAFADRWWHGTMRGTDVLFPSGESMVTALRGLKGTAVSWQACVTWFRSAVGKAERLTAERMTVAAALRQLSFFEQACEEASCLVEDAQTALASLMASEPATRERVTTAEEEYRAALAALGAHDLRRPGLTTITPDGVVAFQSRSALTVALAGGVRRGRNWRDWTLARRELRVSCEVAERRWDATLREAEVLRADVGAARLAIKDGAAEVTRIAGEMEPLARLVAEARERWTDHVPVGPSQAETEDPALIEWRETSAPWADEEYVSARAEVFIAALELHKALIVAQADVFEANLAALMELISAEPVIASTDSDSVYVEDPAEAGLAGGRPAADVVLAAWRSFFLLVPVVQVPFEATETLFEGLGPQSLGWLLAAGADQLTTDDVPALLHRFSRAVFAGDTVTAPPAAPRPTTAQTATAQHVADGMVRYGTWLAPGCDSPDSGCAAPGHAEPRWVGTPLRFVRGQDRTTVDRRNDLGYDGLLVSDGTSEQRRDPGPGGDPLSGNRAYPVGDL